MYLQSTSLIFVFWQKIIMRLPWKISNLSESKQALPKWMMRARPPAIVYSTSMNAFTAGLISHGTPHLEPITRAKARIAKFTKPFATF
jgi:hypothetical protein